MYTSAVRVCGCLRPWCNASEISFPSDSVNTQITKVKSHESLGFAIFQLQILKCPILLYSTMHNLKTESLTLWHYRKIQHRTTQQNSADRWLTTWQEGGRKLMAMRCWRNWRAFRTLPEGFRITIVMGQWRRTEIQSQNRGKMRESEQEGSSDSVGGEDEPIADRRYFRGITSLHSGWRGGSV